jgi:hypothetical protein
VLLGVLWFVLLTAAGLLYPRRPRISGLTFIALGILSIVVVMQQGNGLTHYSLTGFSCIALGIWYLVKFRDPNVRDEHVRSWTAKA